MLAGVAVMVRDKYAVRLAAEQREELQRLIRVGKRPARVTARARILLKSDDGWTAPQVAEALDVALGTVYRVKQRFTEEGLAGVLKDRPQANRRRKLDDRGEAHPVSSTGQALNTHRPASLYQSFPAPEARRIAKRLEFHYTPKHGSWLNMAEIEFSVLSRSCLKQRVPNEPALRREVQALVTERNAARATINWRFSTQDARGKLHRLYPFDSKHDY